MTEITSTEKTENLLTWVKQNDLSYDAAFSGYKLIDANVEISEFAFGFFWIGETILLDVGQEPISLGYSCKFGRDHKLATRMSSKEEAKKFLEIWYKNKLNEFLQKLPKVENVDNSENVTHTIE